MELNTPDNQFRFQMERYAAMQPPPPPSPPRNPGHEHRKHQQQTPARPCKKRGRKPGIHSSAVQRNAANARERSRMRVLSTAFANLKSVLPWVPRDTKLSKLDTLKLASGYIAYLKSKLDDPGDQDTSSSVFPPPISKDPIFGALTKGSTARLRIKHEDQSAMQTSPMEWVFNNESMEYLNHSSCTPFFSHTACETAASTTNSLVVSGSQSVPSSSIPTPSQLIDDNLPTIVFQRPFFQ